MFSQLLIAETILGVAVIVYISFIMSNEIHIFVSVDLSQKSIADDKLHQQCFFVFV